MRSSCWKSGAVSHRSPGSEWFRAFGSAGKKPPFSRDIFGLHLESRAEAIMVIDPENELTDSRFPRADRRPRRLLLIDQLVH